MDEVSSPINGPVFSLMDNSARSIWIMKISSDVLQSLNVTDWSAIEYLRKHLESFDEDEQQISSMKFGDVYRCEVCNRTYVRKMWLKKHLMNKHNYEFHVEKRLVAESNAVSSFLRMSLLLRDTCDAYKMGDGDRLVNNAHLEWIFASAARHTKYRLWLWRLITYIIAVLDPVESYEYKWNMTANLKGGYMNNIPNDASVEMQVRNIKKQLNTQGPNKSFESARTICLTTQVVDKMKDDLMKSTKTLKCRNDRPEVDKSVDIVAMVKCLRSKGPCHELTWDSFKSFKDPLHTVKSLDLFEWINGQKNIAHVNM